MARSLSIFLLIIGIWVVENLFFYLFFQGVAIAAPSPVPDLAPLPQSLTVLEDKSATEGVSAEGASIFEANCAGCHAKGGNIIRRGKNLKLKTLQRRKLDTVEAIAQLVTQGKGIMSAYGDRLTPAEIEAVSGFVLEQATDGWNSLP